MMALVLEQIAHPPNTFFSRGTAARSPLYLGEWGLIRTIKVQHSGTGVNSRSVGRWRGRILFNAFKGSGVLTIPAHLLATMSEGTPGRATMVLEKRKGRYSEGGATYPRGVSPV